MTVSKRYQVLYKLKNITDLPTLPDVMTKLSDTIADPNCSAKNIVDILNSDPAIASKILKTVNSPLFSAVKQTIDNLQHAIVRLGFKEVQNIALSTAIVKMFEKSTGRIFDMKQFWKHSLFTSLVAIELGKRLPAMKLKSDELHIAGLLHGIGKIILDTYFPDDFEKSMSLALHAEMPLYQAEEMLLGINHCELGYMVALNWNLPVVAINTIRFYNTPSDAPVEHQRIAEVINMAHYIVSTQDFGISGDVLTPNLNKKVWDSLKLVPDDIQAVIESVKSNENVLATILQ